MGPVFSGSIIVSMAETRKAEIPNFTGGEAATHHAAGQSVHLPHVVHAVDRDAQGREVHQEQREGEDRRGDVGQQRLRQGRPRHDHQGARGGGAQGRRPTSRPIRARSTSPAPCCKAKQTNADALFVYTNEEESARALRELRKQGYDKPIIGETTLTGQKVIELAGDAANGAVAHVGLTADAPQPADQGVRRQVPEGIQVQERPQRHEGLQRHVRRQGRHREEREVRQQGVRQGDAGREDLGQGVSRASCST